MSRHIKPRNYSFLNKFTYYKPGVSGLFALLGFLLIGAMIGNGVSAGCIAVYGLKEGLLYGQFVSYPLMFIPVMIFASIQSRNNSYSYEGLRLDNKHFSPLGGVLCALMAIVATVSLSFCSDALQTLLPKMPAQFEETMKTLLSSGKLWINFLLACIFAPFFEEWLCRGMVLRGLLANKIKPVWAIIISAVFFAVIHVNPWQAVPAFLLGCLFGYVYYKTGSLKLTMLMHFANNFLALVLSNLKGFEEVETWEDVFPGGYYWIIFAACILLVVLTVRAFARVQQERPEGNMDPVKPLFEE